MCSIRQVEVVMNVLRQKSKRVPLLLLIVALLGACSDTSDDGNSKLLLSQDHGDNTLVEFSVNGGEVVEQGDRYPFLVELEAEFQSDFAICAGAILDIDEDADKAYILTNAKCVVAEQNSAIRVMAYQKSAGFEYLLGESINITIHPDWNPKTHAFDFALLTVQLYTNENFEQYEWAKLALKNDYQIGLPVSAKSVEINTTAKQSKPELSEMIPESWNVPRANESAQMVLAGWGGANGVCAEDERSADLRHVALEILDRTSCVQAWGKGLDQSMFCGGRGGIANIGYGDIGSAAFTIYDGQPLLRGLAVFGTCNKPAVFSDISVASDWIFDRIKKEEEKEEDSKESKKTGKKKKSSDFNETQLSKDFFIIDFENDHRLVKKLSKKLQKKLKSKKYKDKQQVQEYIVKTVVYELYKYKRKKRYSKKAKKQVKAIIESEALVPFVDNIDDFRKLSLEEILDLLQAKVYHSDSDMASDP